MEKVEEATDVLKGIREEQDGVKIEAEGERQKAKLESMFAMSTGKAKQVMDEADSSKLAGLLNHMVFEFMPCANGELKEEDIGKINPGGALIASIQVAVPNLPINHPFIILGVRLVSVYLTVKRICGKMKDKLTVGHNITPEVKEDWETVKHA